ncbi:hypothetical protein [Methylocella sp.]|uniref:hypothetical protein n=1 Tax=Methylocella sp. TaxID=1978226 RepID=UPI003783567C
MINIISNDIAALYAAFMAAATEYDRIDDTLDCDGALGEAAIDRRDLALEALADMTPRTQAEVAILAQAALDCSCIGDIELDRSDPLSRMLVNIWRSATGETGEPPVPEWTQPVHVGDAPDEAASHPDEELLRWAKSHDDALGEVIADEGRGENIFSRAARNHRSMAFWCGVEVLKRAAHTPDGMDARVRAMRYVIERQGEYPDDRKHFASLIEA